MQKLKLVFWQNVLSIHQSSLIRSLASYTNIEVYLGYEQDLPESRLTMGWTIPDFGHARLVNVRTSSNYEMLINFNDATTFHCFSGYFSFPLTWSAFNKLQSSKAKLCVLSEAFNFLGVTGWIRLQRARYYTMRWQNKFDAILAMGKLGTSFYKAAGFPESKLFEFAYFVEQSKNEQLSLNTYTQSEPFRLLYVGQLIPRKGIDILFRALGLCSDVQWQLDIVGDGPQRASLHLLAQKLDIAEKVTFHGNQPNAEAVRFMRAADLLVLPSRWDGWGAVVNEALMVGTPVICSDKCGAASLLREPLLGVTFGAEDFHMLALEIRKRVIGGKLVTMVRGQIMNWANCLRGEQGADYLLQIIDDLFSNRSRPIPPWYTSKDINGSN